MVTRLICYKASEGLNENDRDCLDENAYEDIKIIVDACIKRIYKQQQTHFEVMNYIIQTPSARRLKEEIKKRVGSKFDANDNGIDNWQCVETDGGDKALVLMEGQWAEKGCITMTQVDGRNELQVRFFYWETCEVQDSNDDKYMLGRFTELLLTHFTYFINRIVIE